MSNSHYAQSEHNKDTHDFLNTKTPKYSDWEITVLFYAALHGVNHNFQQRGFAVPASHFKRNKLVEKELPLIYKSYRKLHTLSIQSRYSINKISDATRNEALRLYLNIVNGMQHGT